MAPSDDYCKSLVKQFEECAIKHEKNGGKSFAVCQLYKRRLEESCAEFKSDWSHWWTCDLRKDRCESKLREYSVCASVYGKTHSKATSVLRELREECYDVFNI